MDYPYDEGLCLMKNDVGAFRGHSSTSGFERLRDGSFR